MALSTIRRYHSIVESEDESSSDESIDPIHSRGLPASIIRTLRRDIESITEMLEEYDDMKEDFLRNFGEWETLRKTNINNLTKVADDLDNIQRKCNKANQAATTVGLISGLIGIVSSLLMLRSGSNTSSLQQISKVGTTVSSLAAAGISVAEVGLTMKSIKEAKRLLQKEAENFSDIADFFVHTRSLTEAISEIFKLVVLQNIFRKLLNIFGNTNQSHEELLSQVTEVVTEELSMYTDDLSPTVIDKTVLLCTSLFRHTELLESIERVGRNIENEPIIIPFAKPLSKILIEAISFKCGKPFVPNPKVCRRDAVINGMFQAVTVAVDIFTLISLDEDIKKGSKSEYGSAIRDVKDQLHLQFVLISKAYKILKSQ